MSDRFDEFSKSVAEQLPRRESLRRFGAIFVGAVVAPLGLDAAVKRTIDPCKAFCKCRNKAKQKQCLAACAECNKETNRLSGTCGSYTCCGTDQSSCGGYCADLSNDFYNCGSCGNYCESPDTYESGACIDGNCEYWCIEGAENCDGRCTPLNDDYENCGACGNICTGSTPYCNNGVCSECQPGLVACGNVCGGSTPYCIGGVCGSCPPGSGTCDGQCVDLMWDSGNCGGCGNVCPDQFGCAWGVCEGSGDNGYGYSPYY